MIIALRKYASNPYLYNRSGKVLTDFSTNSVVIANSTEFSRVTAGL